MNEAALPQYHIHLFVYLHYIHFTYIHYLGWAIQNIFWGTGNLGCWLQCKSLTILFLQIQDIIRMPHLLTVFRVSEESHGDVDVAILQALLKGREMLLHKISIPVCGPTLSKQYSIIYIEILRAGQRL